MAAEYAHEVIEAREGGSTCLSAQTAGRQGRWDLIQGVSGPELVLRPLMLSDTKHRGEILAWEGQWTKALGFSFGF